MMTFNTDTFIDSYRYEEVPEWFREERFGFCEQISRRHFASDFLNKFFHIFS